MNGNKQKPGELGELTKEDFIAAQIMVRIEQVRDGIAKLLDFYTEREKADTIAEAYNITTSTKEVPIHAPVFKGVRMHWFWIQIDNFDETNNVKIGLNGDSDSGIIVKAKSTKTISYGNLKVDYIRYRAVAGTPAIQIICLRPRYHGK